MRSMYLMCFSLIYMRFPHTIICEKLIFIPLWDIIQLYFTEVLFHPTLPTCYVFLVTLSASYIALYVPVSWPGGKAQPTSS